MTRTRRNARPPLTKDFLRGDSELDDLWLTEAGWTSDQQIEVLHRTPVCEVDPARRVVITDDGTTISYGDLVLATGSRPVPLPVPGGDHPGLIHVRDLDSGHQLRDLAAHPDQPVIVIGSGFIGCEAAASLALRGLPVRLISAESTPHASRLGEAAGQQIHRWLHEAGVRTRLGSPAARIVDTGDGFAVHLDDGDQLTAAAIVVGGGGGARPDLSVAERAGLSIENGGVVVDASMQTTVPHVFAAGDLAYAPQHRRRPTTAGRALGRRRDARDDRRQRRGRHPRSPGTSHPDSGPPSATGPSSTRPGATATTTGCSPVTRTRGRSGFATVRSCAVSSPTRTTTPTNSGSSCWHDGPGSTRHRTRENDPTWSAGLAGRSCRTIRPAVAESGRPGRVATVPSADLPVTGCPKRMAYGPCGGVRPGGGCEMVAGPCVFATIETLPDLSSADVRVAAAPVVVPLVVTDLSTPPAHAGVPRTTAGCWDLPVMPCSSASTRIDLTTPRARSLG